QAETHALFRNPRHPYTRGLLRSLPSARNRGERLPTIPGIVPDLRTLPPGCRFQDRCDLVTGACRTDEPTLQQYGQNEVSCFHAEASG
ncbi:MAG: peptide ABC transporter ATP-binding protein, partial [Deltaproteobacteria bacterium]